MNNTEKPIDFSKIINNVKPTPVVVNKPWYKKKGTIIGLSSTLGAGVIATAVAVPLVLIGTQNTAEISKVKTYYDEINKTALLVVDGKNLPSESNSYKVFSETKTKAFVEIKPNDIKLTFISGTEINLDVKDSTLNAATVFKVELVNGATNANSVISKPSENAKKPSFTIATQPITKVIEASATTTIVDLVVVASQISNPVTNGKLTYQWKMSDVESVADETKWQPIPNATSATYKYDAKGLANNTKKYFKCTINYTYAPSITSDVVYVEKATATTIVITQEPSNTDLTDETSITLSVSASVANPITSSNLSYQWMISDTQTGTFNNIDSATNNTYTINTINIGYKKYFKCVVSYVGATPVSTNVFYVSRPQRPVLTISTQPIAKTLTSSLTSFQLITAATVEHPNTTQTTPTYQWQSSSSENGTYANIVGATSATYNHELDANTKNSWRDTWYKCVVSYPNAESKISNIVLVKMELTEIEAKAELFKWLAIDANPISILTHYFNGGNNTPLKNGFFNSLHDNRFVEGNPNVVVDSITPTPITTNAQYPVAYKSYTLKLRTTSPVNITSKTTGAGSTRTTYPAGMIIEFNTLFSFGSEKVEFYNTNNSKYNMILEPSFTQYENKPTTTLVWNSTSDSISPSNENPIKKGNYPVKFYANATDTNPVITDSLLLPSRMEKVFTSGNHAYFYTMIPTYHIRTNN